MAKNQSRRAVAASAAEPLMTFQAPEGAKVQEGTRVEFEFWDPTKGDILTGKYISQQAIPQDGTTRPGFVIATGDVIKDANGEVIDSGNRCITGADAVDKFSRISVGKSVFVQFLGGKPIPGKTEPMKVYGVAVL